MKKKENTNLKKLSNKWNPLYYIPLTIILIILAIGGRETWIRLFSSVGAILGMYILYSTYPKIKTRRDMKSKSEKVINLSFGAVMFMIFLLFLMAFGISSFIQMRDKPEFTIYEEVCKNKSIFSEGSKRIDVKDFGHNSNELAEYLTEINYSQDSGVEIQCSTNLDGDGSCVIGLFLREEESCEQVEVERAEIPSERVLSCIDDVCEQGTEWMRKEYLTINWLDRACECIEPIMEETMRLDGCRDAGDAVGCDAVWSKQVGCNEYKCDKFLVKVN